MLKPLGMKCKLMLSAAYELIDDSAWKVVNAASRKPLMAVSMVCCTLCWLLHFRIELHLKRFCRLIYWQPNSE